jgi:hypothetical protein
MQNNQIVLNDKRIYYKIILILNICFLFYNLVCIFIDIKYIDRNIQFYHYIITLFSIFLSTTNNTYYEYLYYKNYGRIFSSIEEYKIWKKQNKNYAKYIFKCCEYLCLITFLFSSLPIGINNNTNLYIINIFLMQLLAIFIIFIIFIYTCFFIGIICSGIFFTKKTNVYKETIITKFNNLNEECVICLDINEKTWIKTHCNHSYHEECFNEWIKINKSCPICRIQL